MLCVLLRVYVSTCERASACEYVLVFEFVYTRESMCVFVYMRVCVSV